MKRQFRVKQILLFLCINMCIFSQKVQASHLVTADITYESVGLNDYKVRLKLFRDCDAIAAPTSQTVNIASISCNQSFSITLNLDSVSVVPVTCNGQNSCTGGTIYGEEQIIYEGIVNLSLNCNDWRLSYDACCRYPNSTLPNASSTSLYVSSGINHSGIAAYNSSPVFESYPIIIACLGEELHYSHGVVDSEGDSLVFSLVAAQDNGGVSIPYNPTLSGTNPMYSSSPITINSATGDVVMTPSTQGVGVICIKVEEYRNGWLIGDVTRDAQIRVIDCMGNSPPIASGVNGTADNTGVTGAYNATFEAGVTTCFDIATFEPNGDSVLLGSAHPNGGVFMANSMPANSATFCWTPTMSDIGTHLLTVNLSDDACSILAKNYFVYTLEVIDASECLINGRVSYWDDASRLLVGQSGNIETKIYASVAGCGLQVPIGTPDTTDQNGMFVHDINNGSYLHFNRDYYTNGPCPSSLGVIEAHDAYLANIFANGDPGFTPNPYQVIAMDVDMNGIIDSSDASQILDRSINAICNFTQDWTTTLNTAKEWRFTDSLTATAPDYLISSNFPASDNQGYSNMNVPTVPDCLDAVPASNCSFGAMKVQACLLGDVDGSWDAADAPVFLTNPHEYLMDLDQAVVEHFPPNCIYTIPVIQLIPNNIKSFNFEMYPGGPMQEIIPGQTISSSATMKWDVGSRTAIGGFANNSSGFLPSGPLFYFKYAVPTNVITPNHFDVIRVRINGIESDLLVDGMSGCITSNEDIIRESIKINPNPATQNTVINYQSFQNEINDLTLWNTQGQLIRTLDIHPSGQTEIQLSDYPAGVYILRVNEYGFRLLVLD